MYGGKPAAPPGECSRQEGQREKEQSRLGVPSQADYDSDYTTCRLLDTYTHSLAGFTLPRGKIYTHKYNYGNY